eukprot:gene25641-11300_t
MALLNHKLKVSVASSDTAKAPVQPPASLLQPCRVMLGSSLPRSMRARVQASARVCSAQKKKTGAATEPVHSERALSPTGKVALGPWLGPFASLESVAELPATLYLDRFGSAHVSLNDANTSSAEIEGINVKVSRSSEVVASHWMKPAKSANWNRSNSSSLRKHHQINQPRPRSMSA